MLELPKRKYVLYQAIMWGVGLPSMVHGLRVAYQGIAVYLHQTEGESRLAGLAMCSLTLVIWGVVWWLNKRCGYHMLRSAQKVVFLIALLPLGCIYLALNRHLEAEASREPLAGLAIAMFTLWFTSVLFAIKMQEIVYAWAGHPLVKIAPEK